jgi:hypothetical protein
VIRGNEGQAYAHRDDYPQENRARPVCRDVSHLVEDAAAKR